MLGDELKNMREARGLGMAKLAELSGVSRQHLYAIEGNQSSQPNTSTLNKLARGLSSWRNGEPDESEAAALFRELQEATGYPVDQLTVSGDVPASPVPQPLAGPMLGILDGWARWGETDRDIVVKLLSMAAKVGELGPDSMVQHGTRDKPVQNTTLLGRKSRHKLLAL